MKTYGDERREWLKNLKVGDKVIVEAGRIPNTGYVDRIAKMTPTRIITLKGDMARAREGSKPRMFSADGYERGDRGSLWNGRTSIEPYTEEAVREIQKYRMVCALLNMGRDKLSLMSYEALKTAHDALFKPEEKEET